MRTLTIRLNNRDFYRLKREKKEMGLNWEKFILYLLDWKIYKTK